MCSDKHTLAQKHTLPTSLSLFYFFHFPPLFPFSLAHLYTPPSFQARELTVLSLMNNIDKVGFLLKQTKTHWQPSYLEILILEYSTVLARVHLCPWFKDKTGLQQTARRLVCFKEVYHMIMDVYLQHRYCYSVFTNYIDRCDELCMLL